MILLTKATSTNFVLSLAEKKTLASPTYLIIFRSDSTGVEYAVIPTVVDTFGNRTEFQITEGSSDPTNGSIILGNPGMYTYIAYEQSSTTNLDGDDATGIVERGEMRLIDTESTDYIYHTISTTYYEHVPA